MCIYIHVYIRIHTHAHAHIHTRRCRREEGGTTTAGPRTAKTAPSAEASQRSSGLGRSGLGFRFEELGDAEVISLHPQKLSLNLHLNLNRTNPKPCVLNRKPHKQRMKRLQDDMQAAMHRRIIVDVKRRDQIYNTTAPQYGGTVCTPLHSTEGLTRAPRGIASGASGSAFLPNLGKYFSRVSLGYRLFMTHHVRRRIHSFKSFSRLSVVYD